MSGADHKLNSCQGFGSQTGYNVIVVTATLLKSNVVHCSVLGKLYAQLVSLKHTLKQCTIAV